MNRGFVRIIIVACMTLAIGPSAVLAHEDAAATDPAAGSTIQSAPEQVTVSFAREIEPEGSSIQVLGPDGEQVDTGDGAVDLDNPDRNTLVAELEPGLRPGEYTVEWIAVSASDNHPEEGSFTFTVDPDAPATPGQTETDAAIEAPDEPVEPLGEAVDEFEGDDGGLIDFERGPLILAAVAIFVGLAVAASIGRRFWWR